MARKLLTTMYSRVARSRTVLVPQHLEFYMPIIVSLFLVPQGDDVLSIFVRMVGASKVPRTKHGILEGQDVFWSLKDNIATTQDQQEFYTDHGWEERQHGVENLIYLHFQPIDHLHCRRRGLRSFFMGHTG